MLSKPINARETWRIESQATAIKNKIVVHFGESDWKELGALTDKGAL
jgi:hypothetical protein